MRKTIWWAVLAGALGVGCGDDGADPAMGDQAQAIIMPKSGNTTLSGTAMFTGMSGNISVTVTVMGAPPGAHGVHIHETGDCSAADATSAGGHWNPTGAMHGAPGAASHYGDLGNIMVNPDGTGTLTATNPAWAIGTGTAMDVRGKAIIVHADPDDLATQPTGNAGGRIGCGVIM